MSEELKTLKDINKSIYKNPEVLAGSIYISDLRQEAIKWIKSNNTGGFSFKIDPNGKVISYQSKKKKLLTLDYVNLGGMIDFIEFFNISEEDLK